MVPIRWSSAVLFVDVVAAFDSLIRELVFKCQHGDTSLEHVLSSFHMPDDMVREIVGCSRDTIMSCASVPPHLEALVANSHQCSWFSTNGISDIVGTGLGSKQGDPLGDIIFNLCMSALLKEIEQLATEQDLFTPLPIPPATNLQAHAWLDHDRTDTTSPLSCLYYDDGCFMIATSQQSLLEPRLVKCADFIRRVFYSHGMSLNFSDSKSEAFVVYRSRGTNDRLAKLAANDFTLELPEFHGARDRLRLVTSYKHMGSVLHCSGSYSFEAKNRCNSFNNAYNALARKVFRNDTYTVDVRKQLLHTLLMTRLLYNVGGAHRVSKSDLVRMSACYMRVCRDIVKARVTKDSTEKLSDVQVLRRIQLPSLHTLFRCARLRFCARLLHSDVPYALKLAGLSSRSDGSWASLVVTDFAWLATRMPHKFADLDHPSRCLSEWIERVNVYGKKWNSLLSIICSQCDPSADASELIGNLHCSDIFTCFTCTDCDTSFNTVASLCTHRFRCHGYRNPARYFISINNACPVCDLVSHNLDDAFKHLAYNRPRCLAVAQTLFHPISHAQVVELDLQAVKDRKRNANSRRPRMLPLKIYGPLVSSALADVRGGLRTYG